jgi:hypothetical protein
MLPGFTANSSLYQSRHIYSWDSALHVGDAVQLLDAASSVVAPAGANGTAPNGGACPCDPYEGPCLQDASGGCSKIVVRCVGSNCVQSSDKCPSPCPPPCYGSPFSVKCGTSSKTVDICSDTSNCGGCGRVCPRGELCCLGICANLNIGTTDPDGFVFNCGACSIGGGAGICPIGASCCSGNCTCNGNCVSPPGPNALGGAGNYMLFNNCNNIGGSNGSLKVSLQAGTADLVSANGFSLQLNAWPTALNPVPPPQNCGPASCQCPAPSGVCWMQYVIQVGFPQSNQVSAFIQYWDNQGVNEQGNPVFASLPVANTLPAGWALEIELSNDSDGNVNGINLSVVNEQGQTVGSQSMPVPATNEAILAPNLAFWAAVVGLPGCNTATFTSGNGCINYEVSKGELCVQQTNNCPNVAEPWGICENSNVSYGTMSATCGSSLSQSLSVPNS